MSCFRTASPTALWLVLFPASVLKHVDKSSLKFTGPVDDITEHWPIKAELRHMLDRIKTSHRAVPLCIFVDKKLIAPDDVCNVLTGALIELHFELYHFAIQAKDIHSFNAKIEQVMVLQPGQTRPDTIYKRSSAEEGPIRMNPALAALLDENATHSISDSDDINLPVPSSSSDVAQSSTETKNAVAVEEKSSYTF